MNQSEILRWLQMEADNIEEASLLGQDSKFYIDRDDPLGPWDPSYWAGVSISHLLTIIRCLFNGVLKA